jgi:hypothetical protein
MSYSIAGLMNQSSKKYHSYLAQLLLKAYLTHDQH